VCVYTPFFPLPWFHLHQKCHCECMRAPAFYSSARQLLNSLKAVAWS
jgi:hypothetical protein